jgi:hypothetical protein
MENNYTQFSEMLTLETEEQRKWCEKFLPLFTEYDSEKDRPRSNALLNDLRKDVNDDELVGVVVDNIDQEYFCEASIEEEGLWVFSEEAANIELAACLIQCFLKTFDIDKEFVITWADTCSPLRLHEFSGGTVLITKNGQAWCNASAQLEYCQKLLS